jgi:hypothetical protein
VPPDLAPASVLLFRPSCPQCRHAAVSEVPVSNVWRDPPRLLRCHGCNYIWEVPGPGGATIGLRIAQALTPLA